MDDTLCEKAVALRHALHAAPELSGREAGTKRMLQQFLKANTPLSITDCGAWFYAVYRCGRPGARRIAFRADIDALPIQEKNSLPYASRCPGVAHKCGHDGHAAALAALACRVCAEGAPCDIYFIFQHAEETGEGGAVCAALLEQADIEEVYAFHNMPGLAQGTVFLREGTMHCASTGMTLHFTGAPTHASTPELGRNPAAAISELVCALPGFTQPARHRGMVLATVVQIDVGARAFGVSASEGRLLLTIRAQLQSELDTLRGAVAELAARLAKRDGLALEVSYCEAFPETANAPGPVRRVFEACRAAGVPAQTLQAPMRCSEDFGWYLQKRPGAIFYVGDGEAHAPLHDAMFDFPDEALRTAADVFFAIAQSFGA